MRLLPRHELVKLGKSGPGSRGGKVVGYRKSGDPIYASEKRKKPELVPAKPPPIAGRVMGASIGAAGAYTQIPLIKRYLQGRSTLYHGTPLEGAKGILSSERGIDPDFAGKAKVRGAVKSEGVGKRINRIMMSESLSRRLESAGVPLTNQQKIKMVSQFDYLMDTKGMKSGEAATRIFKNVSNSLIRTGRLDPDKAARLGETLMQDLKRHGHRVYMGVHPSDLVVWGSTADEKQLALGKYLNQSLPRTMLEASTGGIPSIVTDEAKRLKYRPSSVETMTRAQALEEVKKVRAEARSRLAKKVLEAKRQYGREAAKDVLRKGLDTKAVFGASVPTGAMGYLEDFPVLKHLMGANPGLRYPVRQYLETYEPGRDLSLPHNVPRENLKSIDLVDEAGKVRRIKFSDFKKAKRGKLLSRLKRSILPAAMTALGGYGLYRAFKPKQRMVRKGDPRAVSPEEVRKWKKEQKDKTAGVVGQDVMRAAKYLVPAAVGAGGLGIGLGALADKISPDKSVKTPAEEVKEYTRSQIKTNLSGLGAIMGSTLLGSAGGMLLGPRSLPIAGRAVGGAGAGYFMGAMAGLPAVAMRHTAKTPETDPHFSGLPEKAQDVIRKHPWIGGMRGAALGAALPLGAVYTLRKYYPSTFARGVQKIQQELSGLR